MGFPPWVRNSTRLRFFAASKALGAILSKARTSSESSGEESGEPRKRLERGPARCLGAREAACGCASVALLERTFGDTPSFGFLGSLGISPTRLILLARMGKLKAPIRTEHHRIDTEDRSDEWITAYLASEPRKIPKDQLKALQSELAALGEENRALIEAEDRRRLMDVNNKWAGRTDGDEAACEQVPDDGIPL
jgi:hypothetical protein